MPERENDLVSLFVRDLDRIELPPRERWQPAQRKESIFMRTSRTILYAGAVAAVLAVALIAGLALRDGGQVAAPPSATPAPSAPTATTAPTASPGPSASPTAAPAGAITGRLGYPAGMIPPLTVYAISVNNPSVWFSVDTPYFGGDPRPTAPYPTAAPGQPTIYTITGVAPGTYYVLAYRNDDVNIEAKNSPGVYSQFVVKCEQATQGGQNATPAPGCAPPGDHSLIPVTVRPGETVSRIDIIDWFSPGRPPYPPRPR